MKSTETSRDSKEYLEPLMHLYTVLNIIIANKSCIPSQETRRVHYSCSKAYLREFLKSTMHPFVPNSSGIKVSISTSVTFWLYFLFFSFSCYLKIVAVWSPWLDREVTCVTRTSKNAVTPVIQKPPAFISSLASRLTTVD